MIKRYVCGFLFDGDDVLLVEKTHPPWQAGLLNGIGGKVDYGEESGHAMVREFEEETTVRIDGWQLYASERGSDYEVFYYRSFLLDGHGRIAVPKKNDSGECLYWKYTGILIGEMVGNLNWLIPLAKDWRQLTATVQLGSNIIDRPSW